MISYARDICDKCDKSLNFGISMYIPHHIILYDNKKNTIQFPLLKKFFNLIVKLHTLSYHINLKNSHDKINL